MTLLAAVGLVACLVCAVGVAACHFLAPYLVLGMRR
jgi:hypothetical protein